MRILLTTDTVGGVWTFTRELSVELLNRSHHVALASFGRAPSYEQLAWCSDQARAFGRRFQYAASTAPLEWMQNNHEVLGQDKDLLLRVAESFHPDIFHSNQFCYGSLDLPVAKLITAHSDVLSWAAACRESALDDSAWLRRYKALVARGLSSADAVVTPTHWMAESLSRHYIDLPPRHVILNGRSLVPADRSRKLQAVSVGRIWDEAKNVAVLGDVLAPMPILIAGEQHYDGAAAPGHLGSAELLGHLPGAELVNLFSESSVYIATSRYEPFGLAPLEAALCGCAVVANDIPSLREVWGEFALYFTDAPSLSSLLTRLFADKQELRAARDQSATRARELTVARMTDQYEMLYAELIAMRDQSETVLSHTEQELAVHVA